MDNTKNNKQMLIYLSALLAIFLWASAFPGTRYALQYYSPVSLMTLRFVIASLTLGIVGVIKKIRIPKVRDLPLFAASGLSGVFLYSLLFNFASVTLQAGVTSFVVASSPIFTMILTRIFLKEKVKTICWVGVLVSSLGLAAITLTEVTDFALTTGMILIILAAIFSGTYSAVMRGLTKNYTALEATTYTIIIGTLGMVVFLPGAVSEISGSTVFANVVVLFMGIFPAALSYLAWGYALSKAKKTAHVTIFSYLIPFISSVLGFVWLGETLSAFTIIGGVVIIAGMLMTNVLGRD
ncbi:MAG: DMT family transporter [Oscillospiraceae bacterium]|nr:DMT family transporter [Oscillospiraceae bacterium]MCL2278426.1 DMT family transporter [Oscillospiraceae bacterium]